MAKKGSIRKTVVSKLENLLRKEESLMVRKTLTTDRVQVLFLDSLEWLDEAIALAKQQGVIKGRVFKFSTSKRKDTYLAKAQALAKVKHDRFIKDNKLDNTPGTHPLHTQVGNIIAKNDKDLLPRLGKDVFLLGSYGAASELKRSIIDSLLTRSLQRSAEEIKSRADVAHGAETGTSVALMGVSKAASAVLQGVSTEERQVIANRAKQELTQQTEIYISEKDLSLIEELIVNYEVRVDAEGNIQATYTPYVTYQDRLTNRGRDAQREEFIKNTVNKFFQNLVAKGELEHLSGSDSLEVLIAKTILDSIEGKNTKSKRSPQYTGKKKPSNKSVKGKKRQTSKKRYKGKKAKNIRTGTGSTVPNISSLIGVLNQQLPKQVAGNMESPRLNYQTGRFASSVRVTDITQTAKGFPSIGYTYMKYPYQTFEPGYAQGDVNRDPRKLIDASIREIAAQFAIGRFYTRRV